eukprot:gene2730-2981_t
MVKKAKHENILAICEEIIKSFNPTTHSIDSHLFERVGDTNKPEARPEDLLIQQIVYGCFKEKPLLKTFIDDFYRDNASRVLRKDITLYTMLAYVVIFRIDELGVQRFRELVSLEEPSKMSVFIGYVFNEENLWNTLRASWMTVKDLDFVEKNMIPHIARFIPSMAKFSADLVQNALDNAAAETARQEAKAKGEAGLAKVTKRASTVPTSPRLHRPRMPVLPEPERIVADVKAKEVPGFIHNTTLKQVTAEGRKRLEDIKAQTTAQYDSKKLFRFHKTKGVRPIEEVRKEIEDQRAAELRFESSFYNPPPDFSSTPDIRPTAAAILREDALYRKKQAEDAALLKKYEEELRDPTEYYRWQQEMRDKDEVEKLRYVAMRRQQAKQSAEEAKFALIKQKEDNAQVAALVRQQGEVIKTQKQLEKEIEVLKKQDVAQSIAEVRDTKPIEAAQRVLQEKEEIAKKLREELEQQRLAKEEADRIAEEIQADKIRQLRALNTVHRPHVKVFDPTEASGVVLLDSMSYLEMKERQKVALEKQREAEELKRDEILTGKEKRVADLNKRTESILRARQLKAEANQQMRQAEKEKRIREEQEKIAAAEAAQKIWQVELSKRRAAAKAEKEALLAEQEKIKRQQQYLGAAQGQVAIMRERQLQMAKERQLRQMEAEANVLSQLDQEIRGKEKTNTVVFHRQERRLKSIEEEEKEKSLRFEKLARTERLKEDVLYKKQMFSEGQAQHVATKQVVHETNRYATAITSIIHTEALAASKKFPC